MLNRVAPALDFGVNISGTIDLGGALLFRAGSVTPDIRTLLTRGHNNGAWNGAHANGAINSSLAAGSSQSDGVGYGLGSEIGVNSLGGFTINPGDTLIRHTLDGDIDLNQQVNIADFARLAANFNGANTVWTTGDSSYGGSTSIADFAPMAANFNQSIPAALPRNGGMSGSSGRFSDRLVDELLA